MDDQRQDGHAGTEVDEGAPPPWRDGYRQTGDYRRNADQHPGQQVEKAQRPLSSGESGAAQQSHAAEGLRQRPAEGGRKLGPLLIG